MVKISFLQGSICVAGLHVAVLYCEGNGNQEIDINNLYSIIYK